MAAQGRAAWKMLHEAAAAALITPTWLAKTFRPAIPPSGCGCLRDWDDLLRARPFRSDDQVAWAIELHNVINAKLSKPQWSH